MAPPTMLYTAESCHRLDRVAADLLGVTGIELMERAGHAAYQEMRRSWPRARNIAVFAGTGNNAGDGFIVARLAHRAGHRVTFALCGDEASLGGDALRAYQELIHTGLRATPVEHLNFQEHDLLIDALFGTGLNREITGPLAQLIDGLNRSGRPVLSLDIPSGLDASSGRVLGVGVRASVTVTFIAHKVGMHTGRGRSFSGRIVLASLGVPVIGEDQVVACAQLLIWNDQPAVLPLRSRHAFKNSFGHVLVIGGDQGFSGAVQLTAHAAARCGAGLTSVATRAEHAGFIAAAQPEIMCRGISHAADLEPLLAKASVIAIGPGLGRSSWAKELFERVIKCGLPMVLDADALNLLAARQSPPRWETGALVFTPHPGEAGRLLGVPASVIENDRIGAIYELRNRYGGSWVLKGAGSLILGASDPLPTICGGGNPGMATGGAGDVLTGVIAGLWAQGMTGNDAARIGVCLHAESGDRAALVGERGLMAGDLIGQLHRLVNGLPAVICK